MSLLKHLLAFMGKGAVEMGYTSFVKSYVNFFDDFLGDTIMMPPWKRVATGSGWAVIEASGIGGIMEVRSGATSGGSCTMKFNGRLQFLASKKPKFKAYAHLEELTEVTVFIGLSKLDGLNHIGFRYIATGAITNWFTTTLSGGSDTNLDTGVVADTSPHTFRIEITPTEVKFYIDGVLVNTHTTNITAEQQDPEFYIINKEDVNKRLHVDYLLLIQDRV